MKKISVLGSTGSIGVQTLDVVRQHPKRFEVKSLSAGSNTEVFKQQIIEFKPSFVSIFDESKIPEIQLFLNQNNLDCDLYCGHEGNNIVATQDVDLLVVAIVGTSAIEPTYNAILKGTNIALACKEVLVSAGDLIMQLAKENNVDIIPIDSEHAAIKQCLASVKEDITQVGEIYLTASGGPFKDLSIEKFVNITLSDALKHPNWSMGSKITIDSATMMNKGLEVIEAKHLFQVPLEKIKVVVHPQSIIHSLVSFIDGNFLAQLGPHDMRYPIQYALNYPEKTDAVWPKLNLYEIQKLEFESPDFQRFPLLQCAYDVSAEGGSYPIVMNAANEAIVGLFLQEKIKFVDIYPLIRYVLDSVTHFMPKSIDEIVSLDKDVKSRISHEMFLKEAFSNN